MAIQREWLEAWAACYPTEHDSRLAEIAHAGPMYDDVRWILESKSPRSLGYLSRNSPKDVEATVDAALRETDDLAALMGLVRLRGVRERLASVILAAHRPERFTGMDKRAYATW